MKKSEGLLAHLKNNAVDIDSVCFEDKRKIKMVALDVAKTLVVGVVSQIQDLADCYCKHCNQCFGTFKEAMKHERIGEDAHHIHCDVDLKKVLALLEEGDSK